MSQVQKYPLGWRVLHWLIALMVLVLIPVGLWMAERAEADLWNELTNTLYGAHKAIGFSLLLLMVVRVLVKILCQRPPYPENMPRGLRLAAQSVHTLLYGLLIMTPLLGWAGVTAYPALVVAGGYHLPAMPFVPENRDLAARLFELHGAFAITLGVVVLGHIAAAVRHMLRKDGIVRRML